MAHIIVAVQQLYVGKTPYGSCKQIFLIIEGTKIKVGDMSTAGELLVYCGHKLEEADQKVEGRLSPKLEDSEILRYDRESSSSWREELVRIYLSPTNIKK